MSIKKEFFGETNKGEKVYLFTLINKNNVCLKVMNFGGRMVQLYVPDKNGKLDDIIMGFDKLDPYTIKNPYFGALVGRCANRISNSKFCLNGKEYSLDKNADPHHLHGGIVGFDKRVWKAEIENENGQERLKLSLESEDGDQGYPGKLNVEVWYGLNDDNEVSLEYRAKCDQDTIINMTNHNYFNLLGHNKGTIEKHLIEINADKFTPTDKDHIPYGTILDVEGTPMDLREMKEIGSNIDSDYDQIKQNGGYDVNYVLNNFDGNMREVCHVKEIQSGRGLIVKTNMPAMQFYTANYINNNFIGKGGYSYPKHCGFCLETQDYPNSPNTKNFPSIILKAGEEYYHHTIYKFTF